MRQFIEITQSTGQVCVELPNRRVSGGYAPENISMWVKREGARNPLAIYPSVQVEGGKLCFTPDDDFIGAHPGWYIGTIYNCKKPIHSVRMFIPRAKFGAASVQKTIPDCPSVQIAPCPTTICDPEHPTTPEHQVLLVI